MTNIPLSASRIKTLQSCSWVYYARYILKTPDTQNEGSARGGVIHTIFEVLGNPRHKKHFKKIVILQDIAASAPVERLVLKLAKKSGVSDFENLDLINKMILEGLNYDFYGEKNGKPTEAISEKDFDLNINQDGKNFRILGFIDKLFLFKKKKLAIIRDFKSSKSVFTGEDLSDNMQNLMYCLAVKYLYPEYLKRKMEFLFLKFDLNKEGLVEMEEIDSDELDGFEMFLTQVQKTINNFNEETAVSNMAYDKGFVDGFAGRTMCGRAKYQGQLKKDGTPMWECSLKRPFDYYVLLNPDGKIIASAFTQEELIKKQLPEKPSKIEKRAYGGCPRFNFEKKSVDNYDPFL